MATPVARTRAKWSGKLESSAVIGGGIANMLTELSIFPDQFIAQPRYSSEQWFYAAMLSDAEHSLHLKKERHYVVEWLNAEWDSPCTFAMVCDALQLDPDFVRRTLLARLPGRKARALA